MAEARSRDWIPPALLIFAAVLLGLAAWGSYAATAGDDEDESLVGQLEQYTGCLRDHGANVPVIEAGGDGGLIIIVPGSLLEGDVDLERWQEAREQCRHLEPNPLELLFSAGGFGREGRDAGMREACEQLEHDFDAPEYLFGICDAPGG